MTDIFDNIILCKKCGKKMQREDIERNGFVIRTLKCSNGVCDEKIIHPLDEAEYHKFKDLKNKQFRVKMRLVGNSYTVSIPKEIVSFMREQEKLMDDMVKMCFHDMHSLRLNFGELEDESKKFI